MTEAPLPGGLNRDEALTALRALHPELGEDELHRRLTLLEITLLEHERSDDGVEDPGGQIRVRIIAQATERLFAELTLPGPFWPEQMPLAIEVLYPDGTTVRYARELD